MDSTPSVADTQETPPLLISDRYLLSEYIHCCPHAQTLVGRQPDTNMIVLVPLGCRTWSCRFCAEVKIKQLSARTRDAKPSRMLTLTVDPHLYRDPRHAFDSTRAQVSELIRKLRLKFGEVEYLRVTELTAKGWPHYHLLVRSKFIPHKVAKQYWNELTGAQIVDLRQVKQHFRAYNYLVKYLSKLHKIEWTERHVSYSRNFFPKQDREPNPATKLQDVHVYAAHPTTVLLEEFPDQILQKLSKTMYSVTPDPLKLFEENENDPV